MFMENSIIENYCYPWPSNIFIEKCILMVFKELKMLQIAQFLSWASLNDVDILWVIWRLSAFRAYAY